MPPPKAQVGNVQTFCKLQVSKMITSINNRISILDPVTNPFAYTMPCNSYNPILHMRKTKARQVWKLVQEHRVKR